MMLLIVVGLLILSPVEAAGPGSGGGPAVPLLEKGQRLFQQGDLAGALRAFDAAAKADPKDARAPYLRGVTLEKKGDAAGAAAAYKQAIARQADFAQAHNGLGTLLQAQGDKAGAAAEFQAAVKGDPSYA